MRKKAKSVVLTKDDRALLERFVSKGHHPARQIRRAQIILALDTSEGRKPARQEDIAELIGVSRMTVHNVKSEYITNGLTNILERKKRQTPPVPPKVDGTFEAHLIALSCTEPPEGYARWTVRLLADKTVELGYIDSISAMTVSRILKKTNLSLT